MPQLDPSPWFFMLVTSWLVFLFIFAYKIKGVCPPQKPHSALIVVPVTHRWFWLWV